MLTLKIKWSIESLEAHRFKPLFIKFFISDCVEMFSFLVLRSAASQMVKWSRGRGQAGVSEMDFPTHLGQYRSLFP